MIRPFASLSRRRSVRVALVAGVAAVAALALALAGAAGPHGAVPPPPAQPTSADQIQNVDQVKTAIKAYYGDTIDSTRVNPVDPSVPLHTFSPSGAYANELAGIVDDAEKYLAKPNNGDHPSSGAAKAVLFDVDDTTLNTYSYDIFTNFVFNPTSNATFVNAAVFHAVPHMVDLEHYAESKGYTVFFLTGRPVAQHDGTLTNLTGEGYDVVDANLYLKDNTAAWLSSCAPTCTTTQYKSLTRQHIESLGYDIVANFGDQFSDLNGGFSDKTFKIPNPMYFLP